jgi:hypothetical protein
VPGEEPKGQHFVHRAYLEGFQDSKFERKGDPALWVYMPGKSPFRQRPDRVAKRNYYYCYEHEEQRRFEVEHGLQKLEDAALPILRGLREHHFKLSSQDRLTFAGYIALSQVRVPTFERTVDRISSLVSAQQLELVAKNKHALRSAVEQISKETGENIDPEEFHKKLTGGSIVVEQTNRGWSLSQMFEAMLIFQQVIFSMAWTFMLAPKDDAGFLTSDNPVAVFDPRGPYGAVEFASSPTAYFTFPVSKDICLHAQHGEAPTTVNVNGFVVRSMNKSAIWRADTQLYAPFESAAVQTLLNNMTGETKRTRRVLFRKGRVVEE